MTTTTRSETISIRRSSCAQKQVNAEDVRHLLETLLEAREPARPETTGPGDGNQTDRLLVHSLLWHTGCPPNCLATGRCISPYERLETALLELRETPRLPSKHDGRAIHWHLAQRYLQHVTRLVRARLHEQRLELQDGAGYWRPLHDNELVEGGLRQSANARKRSPVDGRLIITSWHLHVRNDLVNEGIDWLVERMNA